MTNLNGDLFTYIIITIMIVFVFVLGVMYITGYIHRTRINEFKEQLSISPQYESLSRY